MQVTALELTLHRQTPSPEPVQDALQALPGIGSLEVTLHTDVGLTGRGKVGFGRIQGALDALAAVIKYELEPVVVGADPERVRAVHQAMLREIEYHGSGGLARFGIAAVDTALWDCLGRAYDVPCWRLWGGMHDRIPAYAMVGWLNYDLHQLQEVCARAVDQGFRGVKIKVGKPTLEEDLARVEAVRAVIGHEIALMVDANQSLSVAEAIRRGRAFQSLGCLWWEEPLPADDVDGYASLAAALDIPVATGENLYTVPTFARFLRRSAVDIVQPDMRRVGGPTAMLQIGLLADAFRCPYASHGGGTVQLNVMACLPNALYLETGLLGPDTPFALEDGCVPVPQGPGFSWA